MKKYLLVLSITISFSSFSQLLPNKASLSPEFIKYQEQKNNGTLQIQTSEGYGLGEIPSPNKPHFGDYSLNSKNKSANSFNAKYDMRTAGTGGTSLLTPVKNQSTCGACWTFTAMAAIESRLKVLGAGTFDLSENNLKECHGFLYTPCQGGNLDMITAYLARKSGPYLESDDVYSVNEQNVCKTGLNEVAYISGVVYLPNDANTIKQAILDYGALYTNMRWEDASYASSTKTYYYSGSDVTNHAVTLVGWDDTKVTSGGTGAWIIKNSWGTGWGESGFFYISYNDKAVNSSVGYFPTKVDYKSTSKVYYYDKLGAISCVGWNDDDYGLVKFVASRNEKLTKVGTWVNSDSTTVYFDIYDNFNTSTKTLSTPLGTLAGQFCKWPGYYTFDLSSAINIANGNDFYIRARYKRTNGTYLIPIEVADSSYANPTIQNGVCWISDNAANGSWFALGSSTTSKYNLCIKAYAEQALTVSAGSASQVCKGNSATIGGVPSAVGGTGTFTYSWTSTPAGFTSTVANPSVTPSVTTTYLLSVTDGNSTVTSNVVVTAINIPVADAGSNQTICNGSSASLAATGGGTYSWSSGQSVAAISVSPSATNTYTVTVTNNTCTATDFVVVTVNQPATVNAGVDQTICASSTAPLAGVLGGSASSVAWSGGTGTFSPNATSNSAVYTPSDAEKTAGSVTLILTTNDPSGPCPAVNDQMIVRINPKPQIPVISQNINSLQSSAVIGNQWYSTNGILNGQTNQTYNFSASGTYFTIVTAQGCSSDTSNKITIVSTGIEEKEAGKVIITPNPNNGVFTIHLSNPEQWTSVEVLNCNGQLVYSSVLKNMDTEINLTDKMASGIYSVKISGEKENIVRKIILR